jgi:hypothetical protein
MALRESLTQAQKNDYQMTVMTKQTAWFRLGQKCSEFSLKKVER